MPKGIFRLSQDFIYDALKLDDLGLKLEKTDDTYLEIHVSGEEILESINGEPTKLSISLLNQSCSIHVP